MANITRIFHVEDDDPSLPEAERKEVFEAGYSTSEEGTGFGLSIVKEIVEAHGWEIQVIEGTEAVRDSRLPGSSLADE